MKKLSCIVLLLLIILSVLALSACANKDGKPKQSDEQSVSSSPYDGDWHQSPEESDEQSASQDNSSSHSQTVSYEEDDSGDWTPFL